MYTYIQYNYIMSKKEPFNSNMLSRKDPTYKYLRIKAQNKYDNNITIIIYNEIVYVIKCLDHLLLNVTIRLLSPKKKLIGLLTYIWFTEFRIINCNTLVLLK